MLEVRAAKMRRERSASVLAAEGGDRRSRSGPFRDTPQGRSAPLAVEKHVRCPANSCTGAYTQPEAGVLHRRLFYMNG